MNQNLKESKSHGTITDPFALYHMRLLRRPFQVSPHWHDEVELIFVEHGELFLTIDKNDYTGRDGDIFFINSQQIHHMYVDNPDASYYTILFPLSSLIFEATDNVNRDFLLPLLEHKQFFLSRLTSSSSYGELLAVIRAMIDAYYGNKKSRQLYIRALLLSFICLCHDSGCIETAVRPAHQNSLHREILSYISTHYLDGILLDDVAAQFHMAPKYFSHYFTRNFHMTLTEHINRLRLEKAIELLETTSLSVIEVALQSGFSSCSYFNRRFKEAFGESPLAYRRKILL